MRPSQYFWTEQFGLDIKVVGRMDPQGSPVVLDGDPGSGKALLARPTQDQPQTVVAINHHTLPATALTTTTFEQWAARQDWTIPTA